MGARELAGAWPSAAARENSYFEIWIPHVPLHGPQGMSKQTWTPDQGAQGMAGSGYRASDGFSYRML